MSARFSSLTQDSPQQGLIAAFVAFFIWGSLAIYWRALEEVPALEILCSRVVWSFVFILLVLLVRGQLGATLRIFTNFKILPWLLLSCSLLTVNWGLYIWAINADMVVETSLGYYINPLFTILFGIVFFRDKGTPALWIAIVLVVIGVLFQIVMVGKVPLLALSLAISFAAYSLIRKIVVVEALPGLFVETTLSGIPCLGYLLWLAVQGQGHFATGSGSITALLAFSGVVTTMPLFLFTYAARRINLSTLGILQYISPSATFLIGVYLFNEEFTLERFITFGCIWVALAIYTVDSLRRMRKPH